VVFLDVLVYLVKSPSGSGEFRTGFRSIGALLKLLEFSVAGVTASAEDSSQKRPRRI